MQFVRQSKFRHVFCKPMKLEFCLNDIRITKVSWDSLFSAVNSKFIAVITEGSGGPFMVIPLSKVGRVEKDYPVVDAHKAPCLEVVWCPFNDNVIASGSEDTTVKVWQIPDNGLRRSLTEPIAELLGHQRRITCILWHPTANNILLSAAADLKIFLWNIGSGEALIEIAGHPDLIWSVDFNYNGSKIVTTCKDKKLRVIDPRTGKILQQGAGHEGVKPQRAIFLRDGRIFTTGFTRRSERMYALRDEEALDEPIVQEELDTSNGVLFPLYDPDTGMLYLCGKGDSAIRYYEVNSDPPFVHYINTYSSPEPQRGIAFMPKLGLAVLENEIARVYKCTNKGLVEVLQFLVPRKSELFQDDLYPDTPGKIPAITADDWISGKDSEPILVPVRTDKASGGARHQDKPKGTGIVKKANLLEKISVPPSAEPSQPSPTRLSAAASLSVSTAAPKVPETPPPFQAPSEQMSAHSKAELALNELRNIGSRPPRTKEAPNSASEALTVKTPVTRKISNEGPVGNHHPHLDSTPPTPRASASPSRQTSSVASMSPSPYKFPGDAPFEELVSDIQKLKAVVRRHEKRIRYLEEQLADRDMVDLDGL